MESVIIVNKKIFQKYKDEVVMLTPRIFAEPYFYDLDSYKDTIDLTGLTNFLSYNDKITIMSSTSFIDFVNVLLVVDFLRRNNYSNVIELNYYFTNKSTLKEAMFSSLKLNEADLHECSLILTSLKENKTIKKSNVKLPGLVNFTNFFNMIIDEDSFNFMIDDLIEDDIEDEELASLIASKYSNFEIDEKYYLNLIRKYNK